ncbi:MAG: methionyl-tRNA formyltransferase [Proteobacteria bacterium]|nr:methionyl-tRNA formyltransferase [Pseudomonadota bacterium]
MGETINRIIFMGTPDLAVASLQSLITNKENIVAVITQPDRPKGRGRHLAPPPVKVLAEDAGIPVLQPEKIKTEAFLNEIRALAPDMIIVAAYGRILPEALLSLPPLGTINVHGSLLPKYRGAAPIQWAVLNGEKETGVTIMQMDAGMDTGDILLPARIPIEAEDTSGTLFEKLALLGGKTLVRALEGMRKGEIRPMKQDDSQSTLAPPLTKEQARIDWQQSAWKISCQIRGLDPWPKAYTELSGGRVRLFSPTVQSQQVHEKPGTICAADKEGLLVATGDGYLLAREVQRDGSNRMPVEAFLQGQKIDVGACFGN